MTDNSSSPYISQDSDIGRASSRFYEDRCDVKQIRTRSGLFLTVGVVADGIGGESAGERAAEATVKGVMDYFANSVDTDILKMLKDALQKVNRDVYHEAMSDSRKRDMGSTAAVAVVHQNRLYIANIGDSRIYLVNEKNKSIRQLTVDHTWAWEVVKAKKLKPEEAAHHPKRDELVRSIAYEESVDVDLGIYWNGERTSDAEALANQGYQLQPGDRIVLCSDGLTKTRRDGKGHFVETEEITRIVLESPQDQVAKRLVKQALDRNVNDNVSVVVIEMPGAHRKTNMRKPALIGAGILVALAITAALVVPRFTSTRAQAQPTPKVVVPPSQVYVMSLEGPDVLLTRVDGSQRDSRGDEEILESLIDFVPGTRISTGSQDGFIRLIFPGQASLYLAPDSEIVFGDNNASESTLRLTRGRLLVVLPEGYPEGKRFVILTPDDARMWVKGSIMGVRYDPSIGAVDMDCLQDQCWFVKPPEAEQDMAEGWSVRWIDGVFQVVEGTRNELWQFVRGIVLEPTPAPSDTPLPTATRTPRGYVAPTATSTPDLKQTPMITIISTTQAITQETPTDETPTEETPTDETPTEETPTDETPTEETVPPTTQCNDGNDNDQDGYVDLQDSNCKNIKDDDESQ